MNTKKIIDFLDSHELISVHALEIKANVPASTIAQTKHGRDIPKKHIEPLCLILKGYGMKYIPKKLQKQE